MATWGVHSFENDDAKEWAAAYREMGLFVAKSTMEVALGDVKNAALRADVAARAVAAVEAVAFALGRGSAEASEAFNGAPLADKDEAQALIPMAEDVLTAITSGSELNMKWTEAAPGEHAKWIASVAELQARVTGDTAAEPAPEPLGRSEPGRARPQAAVDDPVQDIRTAIAQLSDEVQVLREEMHAGLVELAKQIGVRGQ